MTWPDFLATYGELLAGGVFALAGLLGLAFQLRLWRRAAASRAWPAVEGRLIDARASVLGVGGHQSDTARDASPQHSLVVEYTCEVAGRTYTGDTYSHGTAPTGTHAWIEAEAARRFPRNSRVQVYYDPDDPSDAVLSRDDVEGLPGLALLCAAMLLGGCWLLWIGREAL